MAGAFLYNHNFRHKLIIWVLYLYQAFNSLGERATKLKPIQLTITLISAMYVYGSKYPTQRNMFIQIKQFVVRGIENTWAQ